MEFFNRAKTVRLKSHHTKYLVADDDEQSVRQSRRSAAARAARWAVEFVDGNPHLIRLKSCHGGYLTASDEPFLLTGKKVLQTVPENPKDPAVEWEPIKEGGKVKLRTRAGKFLRANGATPPWRNSITHDVPHRTATQDWVLWEVETVEISVEDEFGEDLQSESPSSTISSFSDEFSDSKGRALTERTFDFSDSNIVRAGSSPSSSSRSSFSFSSPRWPSILSRSNNASNPSMITSGRREDGMEFFQNAKAVRFQSHLGKYLVADEDEESVRQSRNGSSRKARWTVEFVDGKSNAIRLKSCHGLYLTAAKESFLLGATGKKVLQTLPAKLESAGNTEWQPVKEGINVKLMGGDGKFLRANWGPPPYRNSVTCDIPHRTKTQDWVLWGVDVVDITLSGLSDTESVSGSSMSMLSRSSFSSVRDDYLHSPETGSPEAFISGRRMSSPDSEHGDPAGTVALRTQGNESFGGSPVKYEGRMIHYHVADDDGKVNDAVEGHTFRFKGTNVKELTEKLEEETELEKITVCSKNKINGKLYPLRLGLPPNNDAMHIVVVPSTCRVAFS